MNYFSYKYKLFILNRKKERENEILWAKIEEAEKKGGHEAGNEAYQTESNEYQYLDEQIDLLKTQYLRSIANKMSLPIPVMNSDEGYWETGHVTPEWRLTNKGITEIRRSIRKERKERVELFSLWASLLIGVIGALTGFFAVLKK